MTDDNILSFDFDELTVGEIDFLEDTLNTELRSLLGDRIVSFNDIIASFRTRKPEESPPAFQVPQGKVLRAMALLQLRKSNPEATWEQAGELKLKVDVAPPKATTLPTATPLPDDDVLESLTTPSSPSTDNAA